MVWSDKAGLLTLSCGHLFLIPDRMWAIIFIHAVVFVHWWSSSYVGSCFCAGAVVLYVSSCLCMGVGGCGCGRGCGCVVVVKGCVGGSGHGLWLLCHCCGRVVDAVDVVVVVVRGCVLVLVR